MAPLLVEETQANLEVIEEGADTHVESVAEIPSPPPPAPPQEDAPESELAELSQKVEQIQGQMDVLENVATVAEALAPAETPPEVPEGAESGISAVEDDGTNEVPPPPVPPQEEGTTEASIAEAAPPIPPVPVEAEVEEVAETEEPPAVPSDSAPEEETVIQQGVANLMQHETGQSLMGSLMSAGSAENPIGIGKFVLTSNRLVMLKISGGEQMKVTFKGHAAGADFDYDLTAGEKQWELSLADVESSEWVTKMFIERLVLRTTSGSAHHILFDKTTIDQWRGAFQQVAS